MPLTDKQIKATKPGEKPRKVADGGGLYLEVMPTGSRLWRLKYRHGGKEKRLSFGAYPTVTLKDARERRREAKRLLAEGVDPSAHRRAARAAQVASSANTFKALALEWYEHKHSHEVVEAHGVRSLRRLESYAFPLLGLRPVEEIQPPEILEVLRRIERRGHVETAHRVKTLIGQVFRYGVATGRATRDLTADLRDALKPAKVRHYAAITDPAEIGPLLRAIDGYTGQPATYCALRLAPMLLVRPGELRAARWADIDLDAAEWHLVTKGGHRLLVPLPRQAVEILREMQPLSGRWEFVLPSTRGKGRPLSENTVNAALRRLGFDKETMTGHGFRAMARTVLVERLGQPVELVEMQLGHRVRDVHGRAYNRTQWVEQRRAMLQSWADYLEALRDGHTNVVPLRSAARPEVPGA